MSLLFFESVNRDNCWLRVKEAGVKRLIVEYESFKTSYLWEFSCSNLREMRLINKIVSFSRDSFREFVSQHYCVPVAAILRR